jgi:hypothetical protein
MPIDFVPLLFIMHIVSIAQARNWSGAPVGVSPTGSSDPARFGSMKGGWPRQALRGVPK